MTPSLTDAIINQLNQAQQKNSLVIVRFQEIGVLKFGELPFGMATGTVERIDDRFVVLKIGAELVSIPFSKITSIEIPKTK